MLAVGRRKEAEDILAAAEKENGRCARDEDDKAKNEEKEIETEMTRLKMRKKLKKKETAKRSRRGTYLTWSELHIFASPL